MDLERYDHSGIDIYCKRLRGDHWGTSGDCMDKGITVAGRQQFEERRARLGIDDRDNRDKLRINNGMHSHRGETPDMT